jgi:hypothetical protein
VWATALAAILGIAGTLLVAGYLAGRPGVYWSEIKVQFLVPKSVRNPNGLQSSSDGVIATAGVVAIRVGSSTPLSAVSDNVSIVGEGIRSGYRVRLPNSGGQWANNFDQSLLDVQAAGATPAEVSATMQNVLDRINSTLQSMQNDAGSARANDIELALSPPTWPMYYQSGSRSRTVLATMLLGIGLTGALTTVTRRRLVSVAQRRTPRVS